MDHHWTNSWDDLPGWICGLHPRCVYKLKGHNFGTTLAGLESSSFQQWKSGHFFGADCAVDTTLQAGRVDDHRGVCHTAGPPHRSAQQDLWMCGCVESWPATQIQWTGTPQQQRSHSLHTIDLCKASSSRNATEEARHTAGWRASWRRWRCAGLSYFSFDMICNHKARLVSRVLNGRKPYEAETLTRWWQDGFHPVLPQSLKISSNRLVTSSDSGQEGLSPQNSGGFTLHFTDFWFHIPSSKLTWQQKIDLVKMYLLLNIGGISIAMLVHQRVGVRSFDVPFFCKGFVRWSESFQAPGEKNLSCWFQRCSCIW